MEIFMGTVVCLTANLATTIMRYMPFSGVITKKQKKTLFLSYFVAFVVLCLINIGFGFALSLELTFYKQIFVVYDVLLMGVNMLIIKKFVREHLFVCGLSEVILLAIFTIVHYLCSFIDKSKFAHSSVPSAILLPIVFLLLCPFIKKFLEKTITPFIETATHKFWKYLWAIPYIMFYASYIVVPYDTYSATFSDVSNRVLVTIATLFICRSVAEDFRRLENQRATEVQLSVQQEHYKALSENIENARKTRHDFKHHLSAIANLCESGDIETLRQYCNSLVESNSIKATVPYTGNAAADSILHYYSTIAEENDIHYSVSGTFDSKGIADVDLCVMLGNALDNAITATKKIDNNRFISVRTNITGNVLAVTVENSFDGEVIVKDSKVMSSKRTNRVGVGIMSIKSVCQKYGGDMQINYDKETFSVMMLLNKES